MTRRIVYILLVLLLWGVAGADVSAQSEQRSLQSEAQARRPQAGKTKAVGAQAVWGVVNKDSDSPMSYDVENGDTTYFGSIRPSKVYSRLPKQKGREWRKYYRLVHNFSKAYPYALVARKLVQEADSTIAADNLKWAKRDRYISKVQSELFDVFESQMRNMTVSQGALLMRLIDREVGKSSYDIIKDYKNGVAAAFWQGIAKIFGSSLKKPYDPEGEDALTEELVKIWEAGDFQAFYFSIFWKDPPVVPIPEKYL